MTAANCNRTALSIAASTAGLLLSMASLNGCSSSWPPVPPQGHDFDMAHQERAIVPGEVTSARGGVTESGVRYGYPVWRGDVHGVLNLTDATGKSAQVRFERGVPVGFWMGDTPPSKYSAADAN